MNDQSHLLMSLSYTLDDPRVPEAMRQAAQDLDEMRKALEWYDEKVTGCRKVTSEGNLARQALDADGGQRARTALKI